MDTIRAYHLLRRTLEQISLHYNVTYRIMNGDAYEKIKNIWRKYKAPVEELDKIVTEIKKENIKNECIEEQYWKWFSPLWNYDVLSVIDKNYALKLENELSEAIWKTSHSIGNPYHHYIVDKYPKLRVYTRLFNIKLASSYSHNDLQEEEITNILGLTRYIKRIDDLSVFNLKKEILFIGAEWLTDYFEKTEECFEIRKENYITKALENLIDEPNRNYDELVQIFVMAGMHPVINKRTLEEKAEITIFLLREINELWQNFSEIITELKISEWNSLIQFIVFLYDSKTISNFNEQAIKIYNDIANEESKINTLLSEKNENKKDKVKLEFEICRFLSERNENKLRIKAKTIITFGKEIPINYKWNYDFEECNCKDKLIKGKIRIIDEYSDSNIDLNENTLRAYFELKEKAKLNSANYEKNLFERLSNKLDNLETDAVKKKIEIICEHLRNSLIADKIIYFAYNGLSDELEPLYFSRSKILKNTNDTVDEEYIRDKVINETINIFKKYSINEEFRSSSSSYRCIDYSRIVSRYEGNNYSPFTVSMNNRIETINDFFDERKDEIREYKEFNKWFKNEQDIMAIPVQFYGRKQGVIHLSTNNPYQFVLHDRNRLIGLVRMIESNLFHSRLVNCSNNMLKHLNEAISSKINEDSFYDSIAKEIAVLYGAGDVTIWWQNLSNKDSFKVIGFGSEKIKKNLGRKAFEKTLHTTFFREAQQDIRIVQFKDTKNNGQIGSLVAESGFNSCIQSPFIDFDKNNRKEVVGMLILHDRNYIIASKQFKEELIVFTEEVKRILIHFRDHINQIQNMNLYIAHDINSFINLVKNNAARIKKICSDLEDEIGRGKIQGINNESILSLHLRTEDIISNAKFTFDIFQYMAEPEHFKNIDIDNPDGLLQFYYHLQKNEEIAKTNLFELLKRLLHSSGLGKRIIYRLEVDNEFKKKEFSIHEDIFNRIVQNLLDNVRKYAKDNSILLILTNKTELGWSLSFYNTGIPLESKCLNNPDIIFEKKVRAQAYKRSEESGNGLGLFIAKKLALSFGGNLELKYTHNKDWADFQFDFKLPVWLETDFN